MQDKELDNIIINIVNALKKADPSLFNETLNKKLSLDFYEKEVQDMKTARQLAYKNIEKK